MLQPNLMFLMFRMFLMFLKRVSSQFPVCLIFFHKVTSGSVKRLQRIIYDLVPSHKTNLNVPLMKKEINRNYRYLHLFRFLCKSTKFPSSQSISQSNSFFKMKLIIYFQLLMWDSLGHFRNDIRDKLSLFMGWR